MVNCWKLRVVSCDNKGLCMVNKHCCIGFAAGSNQCDKNQNYMENSDSYIVSTFMRRWGYAEHNKQVFFLNDQKLKCHLICYCLLKVIKFFLSYRLNMDVQTEQIQFYLAMG